MFEIQETLDPDLIEKGLRHKVVKHEQNGTTRVVGFFSDYFMAVMACDSLNADSQVVALGEES